MKNRTPLFSKITQSRACVPQLSALICNVTPLFSKTVSSSACAPHLSALFSVITPLFSKTVSPSACVPQLSALFSVLTPLFSKIFRQELFAPHLFASALCHSHLPQQEISCAPAQCFLCPCPAANNRKQQCPLKINFHRPQLQNQSKYPRKAALVIHYPK